MPIATSERRLFGEPLTNGERAICGVMAALGAAGPVALGAAAAVLFYVLLVVP